MKEEKEEQNFMLLMANPQKVMQVSQAYTLYVLLCYAEIYMEQWIGETSWGKKF